MNRVTARCVTVIAGVLSFAAPLDLSAQRRPTVAAAANLTFALNEVVERFARERGPRIEVVYGASGTLARQIRDGAPFEAFLAADEETPARLHSAGVTRDAGVVYAVGRLVIFAPEGSPLTVDGRLDGLRQLGDAGGLSRLAIANPAVAPYGRAAEAVLRKRGLWEQVRGRLVLGESVTQAAQFAISGNAAGGLIAYSTVLAPELAKKGRYALIPADDHQPLRQRMVLLKHASDAVQAFYTYLQGSEARAILERHGYQVPQ